MYDHQTETLWSGVTGEALQGPLIGQRLTILTAVPKVRWRDWRTAYPQSQVLTVHGVQAHDADQYASYHASQRTGLVPPAHTNARLRPKDLVMGIRIGEQARAYPLALFAHTPIITDQVAGTDLVVYRDAASEASAVYERQVDGRLLSFKPGPMRTDKDAKVTQQDVDKVLADWPAKPQEVAKKLMAAYGLPQEATATHLVWHNNGPWKTSILYREEVPHQFPMPHTDMLEQVINYRVPSEKFDELAAYDGSVTVRRTKGELSAMCDKEDMNFLALNLAHDVVTGKMGVEEARQAYARDAKAYMQGQKPPYTQKLQFEVAKGNTGDPDKGMA